MLQKSKVCQQKLWNFGTFVNISLTLKWKLWKTLKCKNLTIKIRKSRNYTHSYKISGKALHHFTAGQLRQLSGTSLILLQHASSQQCLSKTFNTFFLSEKEKIFNTKAMVTCKWSAAVVKKLTNYEYLALCKTKKQTQVASGPHWPCALFVAMENTSNARCQLIHKYWQK